MELLRPPALPCRNRASSRATRTSGCRSDQASMRWQEGQSGRSTGRWQKRPRQRHGSQLSRPGGPGMSDGWNPGRRPLSAAVTRGARRPSVRNAARSGLIQSPSAAGRARPDRRRRARDHRKRSGWRRGRDSGRPLVEREVSCSKRSSPPAPWRQPRARRPRRARVEPDPVGFRRRGRSRAAPRSSSGPRRAPDRPGRVVSDRQDQRPARRASRSRSGARARRAVAQLAPGRAPSGCRTRPRIWSPIGVPPGSRVDMIDAAPGQRRRDASLVCRSDPFEGDERAPPSLGCDRHVAPRAPALPEARAR